MIKCRKEFYHKGGIFYEQKRKKKIELKEIPHYDTINNVFENLDIGELRKIQKYMVNRLIRSKMFDKYRFKDKYFQIVIDGTRIMNFKERHCKNCLKAVHNRGKENEYTK